MRLREINCQSGAETERDAASEITTHPLTVAEMLSQLKSARDAAIARGIEVNGVHVQTDDLSQQRLTAAALAAQIDPSTPVLWKSATGEFVELTAPEMIALALAARNHVQSCFNREAELAAQTDAVGAPIAVVPQQSYATTLGDTTRTNLISGGAMSSASAWTPGPGWSIAAGAATHTAGDAGDLSQPLAATSGKYYRIGYQVSGRSAGSVQARLMGGSDRPGTAVGANGLARDRIQAATGNDTLALRASADFDGAIDDVAVYLETSACLSAGTHHVWIEPQTAEGVPGPISGPYTLEII